MQMDKPIGVQPEQKKYSTQAKYKMLQVKNKLS